MISADNSKYPPISDYAIIGDCRCAALVSKRGSIDWLCMPRFDSPSIFAAIIDRDQGGHFKISPEEDFEVDRAYVKDTNVLTTRFTTAAGVVELTDLMPVYGRDEMHTFLCPERQILRSVKCVKGSVAIHIEYFPRPDYGRIQPKITDRGRLGLFWEWKSKACYLTGDVLLTLTADRTGATAQIHLQQGEQAMLSLSFADGEPAIIPPLGENGEKMIDRTVAWWQGWSAQCGYEGKYRDGVIRSALFLKLMTYSPSGAVVAAPTTSLPEKIGGVRNWDYRFCWLRDAAMTIRAFFRLGYQREGFSFLSWMLHSTRLTRPELQVAYDVYGETRLKEKELPHLEGYASSTPVRVGNDAEYQLQLDIYGEVMVGVAEFIRQGGRIDRMTARMLKDLGRTVVRRWREPDSGIWELRGHRRHHTYSKAMCWRSLNELIGLHRTNEMRVNEPQLIEEREAIRADIEYRGYNPELGSYTAVLSGDAMDASLLLLPIYGYIDAHHPRMISTYKRIMEKLAQNSLLYRYLSDDGLPEGEGTFGACSFWAAECLARAGKSEEARERFEYLLTYANDVGLYSEEIDAETGRALGNFPQAFTHVAMINAALAIDPHEQQRGEDTGRTGKQEN